MTTIHSDSPQAAFEHLTMHTGYGAGTSDSIDTMAYANAILDIVAQVSREQTGADTARKSREDRPKSLKKF